MMKTLKLNQKKTTAILFVILLYVAGATNMLAQEKRDILQDLKEYKGNFEMPGFGYYYYKNNSSEIQSTKKEGVAQYKYREAEDLTRIFEGGFFFASSEEDLSLLMREDVFSLLKNISDYSSEKDIKVVALMAPFAIGEFKDDKQVGKWIWAYWADRELFIYKEVNFNEYGQPQGFVKQYHYIIHNGEFWHNKGYQNNKFIYKPRGWMIGEVTNNVIVSGDYKLGFGEASEDMKYSQQQRLFGDHPYHYEVFGSFNAKGPVGKWTISGDYFEDDGKYTVVEFDTNGTCVANYWIDQSTGDKKYPQYRNSKNNPVQYIDYVRRELDKLLEISIFRSTPKR